MPTSKTRSPRSTKAKRKTGADQGPEPAAAAQSTAQVGQGGANQTAAAAAQAPAPPLDQSDPNKEPFNPETLDRTVIAIPLLHDLEKERKGLIPPTNYAVIVDLNLEFAGGRGAARHYVEAKIGEILARTRVYPEEGVRYKSGTSSPRDTKVAQYVFAKLAAQSIRALVAEDAHRDDATKLQILDGRPFARAIYHLWPDFPVRALTFKSIRTVKADAARASFAALGDDIVWAVLDSGIETTHPHFSLHENLILKPPLEHLDFTGENNATTDANGHGTHVAGIIAGEQRIDSNPSPPNPIRAAVRNRTEDGTTNYSYLTLDAISGMAPTCKLVNMRILRADGTGDVSSILAALAEIQEINGYGRYPLIHGVNLSLGNDFEPEWFACGHSPLCVEVNRLVQSGVVVVVAAGNSGYGTLRTQFTGNVKMSMALTVNDPGNAEFAITVGSTHRDQPHMYGVSYFSSKGPTGDGRSKPDLIAPGEKIVSCAAGAARASVNTNGDACDYVEDSGTSMAAPHVSGAIAAFLSIRREFIGQPNKVKEIFLSTATDIGRERYFQGRGMVDLMRAIQSV